MSSTRRSGRRSVAAETADGPSPPCGFVAGLGEVARDDLGDRRSSSTTRIEPRVGSARSTGLIIGLAEGEGIGPDALLERQRQQGRRVGQGGRARRADAAPRSRCAATGRRRRPRAGAADHGAQHKEDPAREEAKVPRAVLVCGCERSMDSPAAVVGEMVGGERGQHVAWQREVPPGSIRPLMKRSRARRRGRTPASRRPARSRRAPWPGVPAVGVRPASSERIARSIVSYAPSPKCV